jgi:hypothetical protein
MSYANTNSSSLERRVTDVQVDYQLMEKFRQILLSTHAALQKFSDPVEAQVIFHRHLQNAIGNSGQMNAVEHGALLAEELGGRETDNTSDAKPGIKIFRDLMLVESKPLRGMRHNHLNDLTHKEAAEGLGRILSDILDPEMVTEPRIAGRKENWYPVQKAQRVFSQDECDLMPGFRNAMEHIFSVGKETEDVGSRAGDVSYGRIVNFPDAKDPSTADFMKVRGQIIERLVQEQTETPQVVNADGKVLNPSPGSVHAWVERNHPSMAAVPVAKAIQTKMEPEPVVVAPVAADLLTVQPHGKLPAPIGNDLRGRLQGDVKRSTDPNLATGEGHGDLKKVPGR